MGLEREEDRVARHDERVVDVVFWLVPVATVVTAGFPLVLVLLLVLDASTLFLLLVVASAATTVVLATRRIVRRRREEVGDSSLPLGGAG